MPRAGPTPFGYERRDGRLVPHPNEAPIRQRMFELFIEHQRKKTVADVLNAEGHRTRNGAFFSGPTIGRLLSDESVTGIPGEIDAIIDRESFAKVQTILERQKTKGVNRKPRHLFAGITHCVCGGKMLVPSGSKKYTCKDCKEKIYTTDLEAIFVEQLRLDKQSELQALSLKWSEMDFDQKLSVIRITTKQIIVDSPNNTVLVTFLDI